MFRALLLCTVVGGAVFAAPAPRERRLAPAPAASGPTGTHILLDGCSTNGISGFDVRYGEPRTPIDASLAAGEVHCCSMDGSACTRTNEAGQCLSGAAGVKSPFAPNTAAEAEALCAARGMRLCHTREEVDKCCGSGCQYDNALVWTATPPPAPTTCDALHACGTNEFCGEDRGWPCATWNEYESACWSLGTRVERIAKAQQLFAASNCECGEDGTCRKLYGLKDGCVSNGISGMDARYGEARTTTDAHLPAGEVHCCSMDGSTCTRKNKAGQCLSGAAGVKLPFAPNTPAEAEALCAAEGMRLCSTSEEMERCCGTGCQYDNALVWISNF